MPHALNIDGVSESLFLIQNLAHGSRSFCESHRIKWGEDCAGEYDWEHYFGWLKSLLCEHLIKSSITLRMILDMVDPQSDENHDLKAIQTSSLEGLSIGVVHEGDFNLTLREAFNKIIHATDIQLDWQDKGDHDFWTGQITLSGHQRSSRWKMDLDVSSFCIAASRFTNAVAHQIDWHHLYKYDR